MTYAASLILIIRTTMAIVLVVPSKSANVTSPPACVNLGVVVKVPDQTVNVNVWSLDHFGADGEAYTCSEPRPDKDRRLLDTAPIY